MVHGRPLHEVADDVWAMPTATAIAEQVASAEELWGELSLEGRTGCRRRRAGYGGLPPHSRTVRFAGDSWCSRCSNAGHRTEALRAANEADVRLAEFGMMPCEELIESERQLVGAGNQLPAGARRVPARRDPMVGRDGELATCCVWAGSYGSRERQAPGRRGCSRRSPIAPTPRRRCCSYVACRRERSTPVGAWCRRSSPRLLSW